MDLNDHRRAIWRRRWQVLLLSLAVAALVFARSSSLDEVWSADAQLQVDVGGSSGDLDEAHAAFVATTVAKLIDTNEVLQGAVDASGLDISTQTAKDRLSATPSSTAGFITVSATGPTADDATALAQGGAESLADTATKKAQARVTAQLKPIDDQLAQLLDQLRAAPAGSVEADVLQAQYQATLSRRTDLTSQRLDSVEVVEAAQAGGAPISPTPKRDAVVAFLVALIVNAELAVLLEAFSGRFSSRDDEVTRVTGLPVLGRIPAGGEGDPVEALRLLRTSLVYLEAPAEVRCLAVIGADEGVGTTFVACGLAAATAGLELPVVLVDGDFRNPGVGRTFGVPDDRGLGDLRPEEDPTPLLLQAPDHPHLRILPAGSPGDDPSGLLSGRYRDGFREAMDRIEDADLVVVDTAGGTFAETTAIAAQCDLCVLVIDRRITRRHKAADLVESLRWVGATPVGVVLNREGAPDGASRWFRRR